MYYLCGSGCTTTKFDDCGLRVICNKPWLVGIFDVLLYTTQDQSQDFVVHIWLGVYEPRNEVCTLTTLYSLHKVLQREELRGYKLVSKGTPQQVLYGFTL